MPIPHRAASGVGPFPANTCTARRFSRSRQREQGSACPLFEIFRDNIRSISSAFVQQSTTQIVTVGGSEETVAVDLVSGSYFSVLGIDAAAGRLLGSGDDVRSSVERR